MKEAFINTYLNKVREHVELYFSEHLPKYTVLEIRRKSYHPEDFLYMVSAKKEDGTYAVWTSWNESTQSLNHGHYGLASINGCEAVFAEYQSEQTDWSPDVALTDLAIFRF